MNLLSPARISLLRSLNYINRDTTNKIKLLPLVYSRSNVTITKFHINKLNATKFLTPSIFHVRNFAAPKKLEEEYIPAEEPIKIKNETKNKLVEEIPQLKKIIAKETTVKIKDDEIKAIDELENAKPLGLFARFKKMYKEYWYVLLPVHVVTSAVWLGGFYYLAETGVDIIGLLEYYGFSEKVITPLRDSKLGHIAVAYLCYKIATPLRYTVTLGGTTVSIKYLVKKGYIKPVLSKDEIVKRYKEKRDSFSKEELVKKYKEKRDSFRDRNN